MRKTCIPIVGLAMLLAVMGCRTPQPELKPVETAEIFTVPPAEPRYNASTYPKEAFNNRDPLKKLNLNPESAVMPARGPGMMPGPGGGYR
ncbi:MAG: hypothetical protein L0Y72_27470 [Gemmataceae bacterium]|nr:hypothetical protein [Gemmataceae bacterium]MCI0742791.1 hypothetical protein [Gemmataceae bacterium]